MTEARDVLSATRLCRAYCPSLKKGIIQKTADPIRFNLCWCSIEAWAWVNPCIMKFWLAYIRLVKLPICVCVYTRVGNLHGFIVNECGTTREAMKVI